MDLDSLNIGIVSDASKAVTAIDNLIASLTRLSGTLKSLDTGGLKTMSANIRSVATAVGALNRNIDKVSFTKADASAKQFGKAVDSQISGVIKRYGVTGKESVDRVTQAFRQLAEASKDTRVGHFDEDAQINAAKNAIKTLRQEADLVRDLKVQYSDVARYISQVRPGSVSLPSGIASEFRDGDFLGMKSVIGGVQGGNIFGKDGMAFDVWYEEMRDALGGSIPSFNNAADAFDYLYREMLKVRGAASETTPELRKIATATAKEAVINFATSISEEGRSLREAGTSAQQAVPSMEMFAEELRKMAGIDVSKEAASVAQMAEAIGQLGYAKIDKAATNIPKVTAALKQMMAELSTAPAVSQNVIEMTKAIGQLQTRVGTMPTQTKRASTGWNTFSNIFLSGSKRMQLSSFSLAAAWGKMYASFFMVFRAFNMLKKAINLSAEMTEQQHVVDVAFGEMSSKVTEFSKNSIKELGMSQLTVAKTAGRFQAMGNALGITGDKVEKATANFSNLTGEYAKQGKSMADMSLGLTRLTADMSAFYNMDYADTAEAMQTIFTGQARPLRRFGIDISQTTLKEWAMKQGLDANVESMTQAEKAMLRYQYVMQHSQQAHGDFARTSGRSKRAA